MYFHRLLYTTPLQGYIGQRPTSYIVRDLDRTIIQIIIIIIIIHRIGKADSPLCTCGAKQTPEHLLISCQRYRKDRKLLCEELDTNHLNLPLLLHTTKGIKATLAFISRTRVATRKWHLGQADE